MLKKLFTLFFIAINLTALAQNRFHDLLNGTRVTVRGYATRSIPNNVFGDKTYHASIFTLSGDEWKGQDQLNKNIYDLAVSLSKSGGLENRLLSALRKDVLFYEKRSPEGFDSTMTWRVHTIDQSSISLSVNVVSVCNSTLVVSYCFDYHPTGYTYGSPVLWKKYEELYYFDLHTGEQIDPRTIIDPDRQKDFLKDVLQRLDSTNRNELSIDEIENGCPFFSGASFFYLIRGLVDGSYEQVNTSQVHFTLEEIQPYLDKNGPFSVYLGMKEKYPKKIYSLNTERLTNNKTFEDDFYQIKDIRLMAEKQIKAGIKESHYYRISKEDTRTLVFKNTYNKRGQIVSQIQYEDDEIADLMEYTYHANGKLKMIELIEYPEYDSTLIKSLIYDKHGNLITLNEFTYSRIHIGESYCLNKTMYTYFNDKIIVDRMFEGPNSKGFIPHSRIINLIDGYAFDGGSSNSTNLIQTNLVSSKNQLRFSDSYRMQNAEYVYTLEKGKVIRGAVEPSKTQEFSVEYSKSGAPTAYTITYKGVSDSFQTRHYSVEYNAQELPIKYTRKLLLKESNEAVRYELEYF